LQRLGYGLIFNRFKNEKMNIRKDTKNLQMLLDDNRKHKNGTDAIKEFHKMHEYIIKLEAKVENLTIAIVSKTK
jgi:hypothetical protein